MNGSKIINASKHILIHHYSVLHVFDSECTRSIQCQSRQPSIIGHWWPLTVTYHTRMFLTPTSVFWTTRMTISYFCPAVSPLMWQPSPLSNVHQSCFFFSFVSMHNDFEALSITCPLSMSTKLSHISTDLASLTRR